MSYRALPGIALLVLLPSAILAQNSPPTRKPTVEDARAFLNRVEKELLDLNVETSRAQWVQSNFITDDTEALSAIANERSTAATVRFVKEAQRFDGMALPEEMQ